MKLNKKKTHKFTDLALTILLEVTWHHEPEVLLTRIKHAVNTRNLDKKTRYKVLLISCALVGLRLALITREKESEGAWGIFEFELENEAFIPIT